jgi:hypothetical protein
MLSVEVLCFTIPQTSYCGESARPARSGQRFGKYGELVVKYLSHCCTIPPRRVAVAKVRAPQGQVNGLGSTVSSGLCF